MTRTPDQRLILASGSGARRDMLAGAGVPFTVRPADVDEVALKSELDHLSAAGLALELARAKALSVSLQEPEVWVLGADQTLAFDGGMISKAASLDAARSRLAEMRGHSHKLHSAAALACDGQLVWSGIDTATLTMRDFSDTFLDAYLAKEGESLLACVGAYRLEGMGAQLFDFINGDYFTVLGLPLWPVLAELRRVGVLLP